MAALDTNILVRFLVEDDAAQLAAARKLIRRCITAGEALFVPVALACAAGERPLWTFDKAAAKLDGARLLAV
jgi:predicted nucleic acid-binding protein